MKKIVLTGGGTAGHVTPNIALLPALQAAGYEIAYVGSYEGIEKKLIADFNIPYTELLRSVPCHEGICGSEKLPEKLPAGCSLLQGGLRKRPGRPRCSFLTYSLYHPRIGYDTGTGQQAVHSRSRKGMLQFPGDYEKYPCRQGCPDRFSHSCGAGTGQPAGRTEHVRLYCQ